MANNCGNTLKDNLVSCDINSGSLAEAIYVFDWGDIDEFEKDYDSHEITKLSLTGTASSLFKFELVEDTANYTDELAVDPQNQGVEWTQTLTVQRNIRNAENSAYFKLLTEGIRKLGVILIDNNGETQLMERARIIEVTDGSGATRTDGSKYIAQFQAKSSESMYFFGATAATNFIENGDTE